MLDTDFAYHALLYQCGAQCAQRPTGASEAQLARFHSGVAGNGCADVRGEDKGVRRPPGGLQAEDSMALEALKPTTNTTPSNA